MGLILLLYGGGGTAEAIPPFDRDDQDGAGNTLTRTAFTDADGYELLAPRLEHMHAADSAMNADLTGWSRLELDRYHAQSQRSGHTPTLANNTIRLRWLSKRAAERFAIWGFRIVYALDNSETRASAATTTVRTDADGYTLRYPTWRGFLSTDSARNSDLIAFGGTDRDRDRVLFDPPRSKAVGWVTRLRYETDSRAGNRTAILGFRIVYALDESEDPKAAET